MSRSTADHFVFLLSLTSLMQSLHSLLQTGAFLMKVFQAEDWISGMAVGTILKFGPPSDGRPPAFATMLGIPWPVWPRNRYETRWFEGG